MVLTQVMDRLCRLRLGAKESEVASQLPWTLALISSMPNHSAQTWASSLADSYHYSTKSFWEEILRPQRFIWTHPRA